MAPELLPSVLAHHKAQLQGTQFTELEIQYNQCPPAGHPVVEVGNLQGGTAGGRKQKASSVSPVLLEGGTNYPGGG